MNPLSLRASNLRSYPAVGFAIPAGICAITGPNGAGKSTLLGAIELALFADGSRDLASALGPFGDRLEIELEFEHNGERYRVRRSFSGLGRGKATLDFEQGLVHNEDASVYVWDTLNREKTSETQAAIEATLGLSRATFNASAFLAQGNSAAFPEASPAERKALLGEILDPGRLWPRLAERAATERRAAETTLVTTQARLEALAEEEASVPALHRDLDVAANERLLATDSLRTAEEVLERAQAAVAANAAAAERLAAAVAAKNTAHAEWTRIDGEARAAADIALALADLEPEAARVPEFERLAEEERERQLRFEHAKTQRAEAQTGIARQRAYLAEIERDLGALERRASEASGKHEHFQGAEEGAERCDRCRQILGAEALEAALASLLDEVAALAETVDVKRAARAEAQRFLDSLEQAAAALPAPEAAPVEDAAGRLARARYAAHTAAELRGRQRGVPLEVLQAQADAAIVELDQAQKRLIAAAEGQHDSARLDGDVAVAKDRVRQLRERLDGRHAEAVRLQEALRRAQEAAGEARTLRRSAAETIDALGLLRLAERAAGRDGVPALLAENTCGVLEAEANRVLERLPTADGSTLRIELRTQKALKGDASALRETLDILVSDRQTTREFLTFSGGERFRVSFALRWALARLLAGRRGAESRLLVVDEPDGLDAAGMDGLASLLREEAAVFSKVLVVSHNPLLAEAFEQVVSVESDGEVSRLVSAREPVEASA